jgi:hypothetical protein
MKWRASFGILSLCIVLALAGCGTGTHPCPSSTATSSVPPTHSAGPVTIDTDHSIYAPDGPMQLTFTDHLSAPVVLDPRIYAGCLWFEAQQQVRGTWSEDRQGFCFVHNQEANAGGHTPGLVPGQPFVYDLDAETISDYDVHLSPGTYRLTAWYYPVPLRSASD